MPASAEVPPIGGATRLLGVIGWPVDHSLSPAIHNAAFAALGLLAALAYASRVARAGMPSREEDWETAARAFDALQTLPGHSRR